MSEPKKTKSPRAKVRAKAGGDPKPAEETTETMAHEMDDNREVTPDTRSPQQPPPAVQAKIEEDHHDDDRHEENQHGEDHHADDNRGSQARDDYDDHEEEGEEGHYEEDDRRPAAPARREDNRQPLGPADDYQFQVTFDRQSRRYLGTVVEFPEIRITSNNPEGALDEIRMAVEDHIEFVRRRGEAIAEPLGAKTYPQMLSVPMSQGLFRKLDLLSRQEKVSIDKLVAELIAGAVERRNEPPARANTGGGNRPQQHNTGNHAGGNREGGNNNRRGGQQGGGGGGRHSGGGGRDRGGRNAEMMENRESFMEYVRNLEKGGGGWKKR